MQSTFISSIRYWSSVVLVMLVAFTSYAEQAMLPFVTSKPRTAQMQAAESSELTESITLKPQLVVTTYVKPLLKPVYTANLYGKSWCNFSRTMLKFDILEAKPEQFGRIKRALLIADINKLSNPQKLPLEISLFTTPWNKQLNWKHSGIQAYPKDRNRFSNIDYGRSKLYRISVNIPVEAKKLIIDITDIVNAWAYEGIVNNGIMLKMGPTIYGMPKSDYWELNLANIRCKPTMQGKPPTVASQSRQTLQCFPSALLPPVKDPYIFHVFVARPNVLKASPYRLVNSAGSIALPGQGMLKMSWFFGPNNPYIKPPHLNKFVTQYITASKDPAKMALEVDEWQGIKRAGQTVGRDEDPNCVLNNDKINYSIKGIIEAKKVNPSFYIAVYWRGEDSIEPLVKQGLPDLLIIEGQSHLDKKFPKNFAIGTTGVLRRAAYAQKLGMLEKTIILIGFFIPDARYRRDHRLTAEAVEKMIRLYRQKYPQMPGMAFYNSDNPKLFAVAEKTCFEVFIKPAPEINFVEPLFNAEITNPKFTVAVKARAKGKRTIIRYDYFIDNRLVARSPSPRLLMDTRALEAGRHILTVHAIDSAWNRAASQIMISVHH